MYHGCSTWKTFWEEEFTGEEKLFSAMNMKHFGFHHVKKHREIKGSDKYVTLDISLKIHSMKKMEIMSSESKENWEDQERG